MQVDLVVPNLDSVPEGLHDAYVKQDDGSFKLNTSQDDGLQEAKTKINEFRQNNVTLLKEAEDLKKEKQELLDLIEVNKKKSKKQKEDKDNDIDLEAQIQERTKQMVDDHQTKSHAQQEALTKLQGQYDGVMDQFHTSTLTSELSVALDGSGNLQTGARVIINDMAKKVWKMDDGNWIPRDPSSGNIMYGSDGSSPMTMKEWIPTVRKHNAFLWNDSNGGGAVGSNNRNFSNTDMSKLSPQEQLSAYYNGKTHK